MIKTRRRDRMIDLCNGSDAECRERTSLVGLACEDEHLPGTLAKLDGCCHGSEGESARDCAEDVRDRYRSELRSCIERS